MLLYIKSNYDNSGAIFNLDNFVMINVWREEIHGFNNDDTKYIIVKCKSEEEAEKVLAKIYLNMTYGSGNMILNLDEFREEETETAKTRKALKNNKSCVGCLYLDTDACYQWDNDGIRCEHYITGKEAEKDVNKEK